MGDEHRDRAARTFAVLDRSMRAGGVGRRRPPARIRPAAPAPNWVLIAIEPLVLVGYLWCTLAPMAYGVANRLPPVYFRANGREVTARTWALYALICIVALGVFFGAVVGKRGPDLIALVVTPTLSMRFVTWLKSRRASRDPRPTQASLTRLRRLSNVAILLCGWSAGSPLLSRSRPSTALSPLGPILSRSVPEEHPAVGHGVSLGAIGYPLSQRKGLSPPFPPT